MSVTSSGGMRGSPRRLAAWALQVVVAAAFFAAGAAKLPAPAAVLLALNALIVYLRRDELVTLAINAQSGQRPF
jgi:hypothetical protein